LSSLATYNYPEDHRILSYEGERLAVNLAPGAWVRHGHYADTKGILIANGDDFVTVLWSCPPGGMTVLEKELAQQISDEIDADILRDLEAINK